MLPPVHVICDFELALRISANTIVQWFTNTTPILVRIKLDNMCTVLLFTPLQANDKCFLKIPFHSPQCKQIPVQIGQHDIIDRKPVLNLEELVNDLKKVSSHLWPPDYSSVKMSIDSFGPCSRSHSQQVLDPYTGLTHNLGSFFLYIYHFMVSFGLSRKRKFTL